MKSRVLIYATLTCVLCLSPLLQSDQAFSRTRRDHLTPQEADLVREAQQLDKRIAVFIKAAERRVQAAMNPAGKDVEKDVEMWGELKGTRADYLSDLAKILDEAITNIDDVSGRDERNPLIPKAVRKLAEASSKFLTQLAPLRDKVEAGAERASLEAAVENAQSVIDASAKLPAPAPKSGKKKDGEKQ
jgi:hypothetical protein